MPGVRSTRVVIVGLINYISHKLLTMNVIFIFIYMYVCVELYEINLQGNNLDHELLHHIILCSNYEWNCIIEN